MTLTQLKYFTTLALLENVSQAAQLLNVSQSSLSKNIGKLESELGVQLFTRDGRRLFLNEAGERFLKSANAMITELDTAQDDLRALASGNAVELKIGMTGVYSPLMDCISEFGREHPEVRFRVSSRTEDIDIPDINHFDALVYPDEIKYSSLKGLPLYEENYFLAVSRKSPLADELYVTARTLEGQNFVFLQTQAGPEYAFHVCSAVVPFFYTKSFVNSAELHKKMIASGLAAGFVRDTDIRFYQNDEGIRLLPVRGSRFKRAMKLCFRREKHLSQVAKDFRDFTLEKLGLRAGE